LGEFREDIWSPDDRVAFIGKLKGMYRTDDDPGLHSAAEWLLRQWGEGNWIKEAENTWAKDASWRKWKFDKALSNAKLQNKPQWYINSQGQTMILIRPDDFWMGSTRDEDFHESHERQHRRRIGRLYAIMAKEVTVEQFQKFRKKGYKPDTSPTVDCPMNMVNWFDAAEYCNWLSRLEDEGIKEEQQCYLANEKFEDGMKLPKRFWLRTGHRLPTEAEWEYACRAGAETARYYGETEELLKNYGRYLFSSLGGPMLPVGSLKPNDFGLFDMHGNAIEWCQDRYIDGTDDKYPASPSEDQPIVDDAELENDGYEVIVNDKVKRVLRGGHFADLPKHVRSANRTAYPATYNWDRACFRVARTILVDLTD
jgi:formylglycine-generating enzyme required for sulfatase activity